jgi:uncharacterized protein (TIGR02145 family)
MNRFIRIGRALLVAAAFLAVSVALSGCVGEDRPGPDDGGGTTTGGGNNCGKDGTAGSCKKITIDGLTWLGENLNYQTAAGSRCYGDNAANCDKYGRLYTWDAAKTACERLGWRLPDTTDWDALVVAVGGVKQPESNETWMYAGKKLKSKAGWNDNGNGTDEYGFSALPGGILHYQDGFLDAGEIGGWWTAAERKNGQDAYNRNMRYDSDGVHMGSGGGGKANSLSTRCVIGESNTPPNTGGGSIVGDWLQYSERDLPDGRIDTADDNGKHVITFKSTGEYVAVGFSREGNVWEEYSRGSGVWSVNGSKLELGVSDLNSSSYELRGDTLTLTMCGKSGLCKEEVYTRVDLENLRNSLGVGGGNHGGGGDNPGGGDVVLNNTCGKDGTDGSCKKVTIGGQTWLGENLNYQTVDSWCYGDSAASCVKYGRMYTWEAAKTACESIGWRLPDTSDWDRLLAAVGGVREDNSATHTSSWWINAGKKLKSKSGWQQNGTDDYGFSALPGGIRGFYREPYTEPVFIDAGKYGPMWTATKHTGDDIGGLVHTRYVEDWADWVVEGNIDITAAISVRCVKGEGDPPNPPNIGGGNNCGKDGTAGSCKKVTIGGKTWLGENLNYQTAEGSRCYGDNAANCDKYGRLYTWDAAKAACERLGWRMPDTTDWDALVVAVGGVKQPESNETWMYAGKKLKSTAGWNENGNGTDDYGFSALPGGILHYQNGFLDAGEIGGWWTAAERKEGLDAYNRNMRYDSDGVHMGSGGGGKANSLSTRCILDDVH